MLDAAFSSAFSSPGRPARRQIHLVLMALALGASLTAVVLSWIFRGPAGLYALDDLLLIAAALLIAGAVLAFVYSTRRQASAEAAWAIAHGRLWGSRSQMEAVLRQLPFGLVAADAASGEIILANGQFEKLLGPLGAATPTTRIGYESESAAGESTAQAAWPLWEVLRGAETARDREFWVGGSDDDGRICLSLSAYPVRDEAGAVIAAVMVCTDVTHRREMETNQATLRRRLLNAQEDVMARLAREMHDEMGQDLMALSLGLRDLEGMLLSEANRQRLVALRGNVESISLSVHRTAWRLHPTSLADLGLMQALRELVDVWARRLNVVAEVQLEALAEPLDDESSVTLYRLVQEALTNIAKHSGARIFSVTAQRLDGFLRIVVEDDGRGFDPALTSDVDAGGFGLLGMQERLSLIGGSLIVESAPGRGTAVYASLPPGGAGQGVAR